MSDDAPTIKIATPTSVPMRQPASPTIIIRGGTTSTAFDNQVAAMRADQVRRQAEQDQEIQLVRQEGAQRHEMNLGMPGTNPVVILQLRLSNDRMEQYCQADVTVTSDPSTGDVAMLLILICPRCVARGIPQSQAQLTIDSRNKRWHLDERCRGDVWVDPDTGHPHILAGKAECAELCTCPNVGCDFRFKISPKSDHPSVSRIIREYGPAGKGRK